MASCDANAKGSCKLYDFRQRRLSKQQSANVSPQAPKQARQGLPPSSPTPPCDGPLDKGASPLSAFGVTVDTQVLSENDIVSSHATRNGSVKNWAKTSAIPRPTMH